MAATRRGNLAPPTSNAPASITRPPGARRRTAAATRSPPNARTVDLDAGRRLRRPAVAARGQRAPHWPNSTPRSSSASRPWSRCRTTSATRSPNWPRCKSAQEARGRLCLAGNAAARGARAGTRRGDGCASAGSIPPARRRSLQVEPGWENAVESALGQLVEGVLVESPETLVDALGELGDGRLALVASEAGDEAFLRIRSHRRCRPRAIRRILAACAWPKPWPTRAHCNRSSATAIGHHPRRRTPRRRLGRRACGAAKQGACCARRTYRALRAEIETLSRREHELDRGLTAWRDRALAAEQQREDAQRSLHQAHRGVAEPPASCRATRASSTVRANASPGSRPKPRNWRRSSPTAMPSPRCAARWKPVARMAELETGRAAPDAERQGLAQTLDAARNAARSARDAAHAAALSLESQRAQVVALAQSPGTHGRAARPARQPPGELAAQLSDGDSPVASLENERWCRVGEARRRRPRARGRARRARRHRQRPARVRADPPPARRTGHRQARGHRPAPARPAGAGHPRPAAGRGGVGLGFRAREVVATLADDADAAVWERRSPTSTPGCAGSSRSTRRDPGTRRGRAAQGIPSTRRTPTSPPRWKRWKRRSTKIDRETRGRFKDTFDKVNSGMQELYRACSAAATPSSNPRRGPLDAGVAIMARPPGKRACQHLAAVRRRRR